MDRKITKEDIERLTSKQNLDEIISDAKNECNKDVPENSKEEMMKEEAL